MKKTIRKVAFIGMLCFAAASCTKEPITVPTEGVTVETVYYTTGDYYGGTVLVDNTSWDDFLNRMLALAREGYEITIFNGSNQNGMLSKLVETFSTTSEDEAKRWAKEKYDEGFSVTIDYDKTTGIYTCTAIK